MKKHIIILDVLLGTLVLLIAAMAGALVRVNVAFSLSMLLMILVLFIIAFFIVNRMGSLVDGHSYGTGQKNGSSQYSLEHMAVPIVILSGKNMVWYNEAFQCDIMNGKEACLQPVSKVVPGLDLKTCSEASGQCIDIASGKYTVYGAITGEESNQMIAYFINDTQLKLKAGEYVASRPAVFYIVLDTYDELNKDLKSSDSAQILSSISRTLEQFVGKTTGFLLRTGPARYMAVIEERHMQEIVDNRFAILDKVRQIGGEFTTTLSIGVGRGGETFKACEEMASSALDMALGRGGDQAAVKTKEGFAFYGGVSRSVEKRDKVKSRIIATALKDLVEASDSVIIMGHKLSDLDSVGSAIGILRFCKICQKPAVICVDEKNSLARNMIDQFKQAGFGDDFWAPEALRGSITKHTLLIVVDTHLPGILESKEIYDACKNVVVIDHHRKMVGHIDNAVIFYHEPYASSASELVAELLPYIGDREDKPTPLEAQSMLAGIMLDTRNFALHTGVRTFEAAAYLRRMGAQTGEAKKLFSSSFESYAYKARLVTNAEIYKGCAVVFSDNLPEEMRVVIPQAANDLLTIDGVQASFVAVALPDMVTVSARSMGEVNVQVIMEQLGGGGHHTMAGVQLRDTTLEQAHHLLYAAIDNYRTSGKELK